MSLSLSIAASPKSRLLWSAFLLAVLFVAPQSASADSITFVSGTTWNVTNSSNTPIGTAQAVCLNSGSPAGCPSGATLWGYSGAGWGSNLSSIPGAVWIWAPGLTGSSSPAELAQYTFSSVFTLLGTPLTGTIAVSADDFAGVYVNGNFVGSVGSTSNASLSGAAQSALTSFNLLPYLVSGNNTISILGQNGQGSFVGCTNCTYSQHPAGVVFGGTLTSTGAAVVPEPSTVLLVATGAIASFLRKRKARRN